MRLIDVKTRTLKEFFDNNVPQYAILSQPHYILRHLPDMSPAEYECLKRWIDILPVSDHEFYFDVTPKDMKILQKWQDHLERRVHSNRQGWDKLRNACKVAIADGYDYLWIDTCCIQKSSSSELSEAINSMFNWYREASVCYVYLCDVEDALVGPNGLRKSRWFDRGW
jgi:hypothetical protein